MSRAPRHQQALLDRKDNPFIGENFQPILAFLVDLNYLFILTWLRNNTILLSNCLYNEELQSYFSGAFIFLDLTQLFRYHWNILLFHIGELFPRRLSPTKRVENVQKRHSHVDENYQGKQGVCKKYLIDIDKYLWAMSRYRRWEGGARHCWWGAAPDPRVVVTVSWPLQSHHHQQRRTGEACPSSTVLEMLSSIWKQMDCSSHQFNNMLLSLSGEYWQVCRRLHLNVGSASQRKLWAYDDTFQTNFILYLFQQISINYCTVYHFWLLGPNFG